MSDPEEPDARDWFRGVRPAAADRSPTPVGEAFGHLPKVDGAGESDWFQADQPPAGLSLVSPADQVSAAPASTSEQPPAGQAPSSGLREVGAVEQPLADASAGGSDLSAEPAPEPDSRVRLRALTGGLADLSDALAAIGVESVALSSSRPTAQPPAAPSPPPAADFRVRCPDCGPQFVAIADVRFVETGDGAESNRYLFTCPACGARVRRPAGPELAAILKTSGVATLALRRGPGQAL